MRIDGREDEAEAIGVIDISRSSEGTVTMPAASRCIDVRRISPDSVRLPVVTESTRLLCSTFRVRARSADSDGFPFLVFQVGQTSELMSEACHVSVREHVQVVVRELISHGQIGRSMNRVRTSTSCRAVYSSASTNVLARNLDT